MDRRSTRTAVTDRTRGDGGFTLVELMVVVLVLAILMAIAIPTFLGARNRSQDRAAQTAVRNTLTAAQIAYSDSADYAGADAAGLAAIEPAYAYVAAGVASTNEEQVSVSNSGQTFAAAALADSGTCFLIRDVRSGAGAGTFYGRTTTAASCTGTFAAAAANTAAASW